MAYIHQRPSWPYFTWNVATLTSPLAAVRHRQGLLMGRMSGLGFEMKAEANLATLTTEVIKSSRIEGEVLDPDEVRSSIARRLGLDMGGLPAGQRVEGTVDMMLDAIQRFEHRLTTERLFRWHVSLFQAGGIRPIAMGAWRNDELGLMQVVSGPLGRERVHFEAPEAGRLPAEMDGFLGWFNATPPYDPLLKAAVAHLWFVTIHPFEDGNGRIARAITEMALARADETKERYYSMSAQIEVERKDYYRMLETTQCGDLDITPWLEWFLGCFGRSIDAAEQALESVLFKARFWQRINDGQVNSRQRLVLNRMLNGFKGHMTSSKYATLAKCSKDTALRDIQDLVARKTLDSNPGRGRGASYRLSEA